MSARKQGSVEYPPVEADDFTLSSVMAWAPRSSRPSPSPVSSRASAAFALAAGATARPIDPHREP